jgi:hypothetical protein
VLCRQTLFQFCEVTAIGAFNKCTVRTLAGCDFVIWTLGTLTLLFVGLPSCFWRRLKVPDLKEPWSSVGEATCEDFIRSSVFEAFSGWLTSTLFGCQSRDDIYDFPTWCWAISGSCQLSDFQFNNFILLFIDCTELKGDIVKWLMSNCICNWCDYLYVHANRYLFLIAIWLELCNCSIDLLTLA